MDTESIPLKPERLAELSDYAKRHDQDTATALDTALADFFAWEKQEYTAAVAGISEGYEDFKAGRVQDSQEVFDELRAKHGLPR